MYDLAVIGGGPAGTSAAITAAGCGARVLLLEKGSFPRHKVCGEFVSAESLALLASLLADGQELLRIAPRLHRARVFIEGRVLETTVEPEAASIARVDLDAALWRSAKACGVDARHHQNALAIQGQGPFVVQTADTKFTARSVIDASGRWSNLNRREHSHGNGGAKWLGLKAHFAEETPSDSVDLYFFDRGYCGVQPVATSGQRRLNVCAMVRSDAAKSLQEVFQHHPELSQRSKNWQRLTEFAATSPLLFHSPEPFLDGILRAGDAAGFVDPFVGDGISLALRGGALAARSLHAFLQGHGSLQQAGEDYQRVYRRELAPVFRASSKVRRLLGLSAPIRTSILYALQNFPVLTRYMVRKTR